MISGLRPNIQKGDPVDTNYCINDYRINELPEQNPLQTVIEDFVRRRSAYVSHRSSSSGGGFKSSSSQNNEVGPKP